MITLYDVMSDDQQILWLTYVFIIWEKKRQFLEEPIIGLLRYVQSMILITLLNGFIMSPYKKSNKRLISL